LGLDGQSVLRRVVLRPSQGPELLCVKICSTKQINTHWRQRVDDTTTQPDDHAVHFGTNKAMQHIKAALRHRVFRDNLRANATPSMAAKYRDFECRALQVFRSLDDPNPPLGTLPAALQPYLYCLAHPSAKTWIAKFKVQHDLSLALSYFKPLVPFDLLSATGVDPTVTSLVTLNASFASDSSGTPGAHSLSSADTRGLSSADALAKLMGKALVTSPGISPNRRLSQRKAPSKGKAPAKALSFALPPLSPLRAATSPFGKSEEAEILPPPPGYRLPPRIPALTLGRTFNPTHARVA